MLEKAGHRGGLGNGWLHGCRCHVPGQRRARCAHGRIGRQDAVIAMTVQPRRWEAGLTASLFYSRLYARALRPALSLQPISDAPTRRQRALDKLDAALGNVLQEV